MYTLVIANRNYSSWSFRAWLYLTESGVPFEEVRIPLFTADWSEQILRYSPAGRVPVLIDGDLSIWDSTAIIEHVREQHPGAIGWPTDGKARAFARSISAEMHSGFLAVRDELPQNLRARRSLDRNQLSDGCQQQIQRIEAIWETCYEASGDRGPWLFGDLSIADIMYAPVALRFRTYGIALRGRAQRFLEAVESLESVRSWCAAAEQEREAIDFIDDLIPATESPLTLG